jgi:hypothetical protein
LYIDAVRKLNLWLLLECIAFAMMTNVSCAQPLGFSIAGNKNKVEIPIEVYNNLIVVPITLNGTLPLKFILDTGVRTAILTQKSFSDLLNLAYTRKYTLLGPGGIKMVDAFVTNNVSLNMPGVTGKGHALLVLDQDYLELRNYLGTEVHGILGYELFSRFIVKVDYEAKMLTLYNPKAFKKRRKFETIPIQIEDTKPYATVSIVFNNGNSMEAKLLVDSGASHPLLLDPMSDPRIVVPPNVVSSIIGRGLGGEIKGKTGRVRSVKIGSYSIKNVFSNFPDPNSYSDSTSFKIFRNGTLGGGVLTRFTVIYNFPKEEIYFKKNSGYNEKYYFNLSGLTVRSTGQGGRLNEFEIADVRNGSAGDKAGLKRGDLIISVNRINASSLTLNEINARLSHKPGKKVRIEMQRDGKKIKTQVILSDEI